jgi:hypothetical protein
VPPPKPERSITTIFQVFNSAAPLAVNGTTASVWPSGMTTEPDEPTPGGLNNRKMLIGALKSAAGSHNLEVHGAVSHEWRLGLNDVDLERHFIRDTHRHAIRRMSPNFRVVLAANEHGACVNRPSNFRFGSADAR